jgi:hypothetical protein
MQIAKTFCRQETELPTLLLRHMTGQSEHPNVQQQHIHPQNNHFTFIGNVFFNTLFKRSIVALNSSGQTLADNPCGNSSLNLLLRPNLKKRKLINSDTANHVVR